MIKQFLVGGLDLTSFVTEWGQIEDVKEILLAKATLFAGEHELSLDNSNGRFSTDKSGSLFNGTGFYNLAGEIIVDGQVVFYGLLKDIEQNHESRIAIFKFENALSKPLEARLVPQTSNGVNPVALLISIFKQIGVLGLVDQPSFASASAPSASASATVNFLVKSGDSATALAIVQTISELCGVSVFVKNGLITATAFRPYSGNENGLGPEITPALARKFGNRSSAYTAFYNQVTVAYGADGLIYTKSDPVSIGNTGTTKVFSFSTPNGSQVAVPDLKSAVFFASNFLSRASAIPVTITVELGPEFYSQSIGDRLPVTSSNWGYTRKAFEIIETHRSLQEQATELMMRSL